MRTIAVALLAMFVAVPALADKITYKDGAVADGKIYKVNEKFVTWVTGGKIEVVAKDKIRKIAVEGEPITDEELAAALLKIREDNKKAILEEEKKTEAVKKADPKKGFKKINKSKSDTKEDELEIEPFPEQKIETQRSDK